MEKKFLCILCITVGLFLSITGGIMLSYLIYDSTSFTYTTYSAILFAISFMMGAIPGALLSLKGIKDKSAIQNDPRSVFMGKYK